METFRITRGRSAIASRDTNAPPSRSLNGFIGLRTHERTNERTDERAIGAVNASYLSPPSTRKVSAFFTVMLYHYVVSISLFNDRNTSFRILLL